MAIESPGLAARIRARNPEAIRDVVHAYMGQILRAARGAGLDPSQAEDVTQETFATFVKKAADFEGRSQVRTWLFGILYKKIAEARRKLQKEQQMDDIDAIVEERFQTDGTWMRPPRKVDAELYDTEVRQRLEECMESVPDRQRSAFLLREVEDLSTPEICEILAVSATNLGVLLFRARNRLRECLEAKGVGGSGSP